MTAFLNTKCYVIVNGTEICCLLMTEDASHGVDQFHPFQTKDKRMLDKIAVIVFSPSLGIAEVILDSQILEKFAQLFILGYSATWDVFMF